MIVAERREFVRPAHAPTERPHKPSEIPKSRDSSNDTLLPSKWAVQSQ
jgi:hypothetical protein